MDKIVIDMIGWAGTAGQIIGVLLNTRKKMACWYIWTLSNVFWCTYAVLSSSWPVLALNICFAGLNVYGWYSWKKLNETC